MFSFYSRFYDLALAHVDPERAHHMALGALSFAQTMPGGLHALQLLAAPADERLRVSCLGLSFANPIGVAAGLDKDGTAIAALLALGFGCVEVGTVTPRPQPGNPQPRMWRVPEQQAVINALGFPSAGAAAVLPRLAGRTPGAGVVGVNLGKNRDTPLEQAADDYLALIERFADRADYLVINISSPNTPQLRALQAADALAPLLRRARAAVQALSARSGAAPTPLLVKVSPDEDDATLARLAEVAACEGAAGLVATNTTTAREGLAPEQQQLPGGLSGPPLRERADAVVRLLYRELRGALPIIGVGGLASAADVLQRMRCGASLVQLYTGFIYGGPAWLGELVRQLSAAVLELGLSSIGELVGQDA